MAQYVRLEFRLNETTVLDGEKLGLSLLHFPIIINVPSSRFMDDA